jgi:rubrerythrin
MPLITRCADDDDLVAALSAIVGSLDQKVTETMLADTRLCGICGCLCRADEACPSCRWDLVGAND